MKACLILIVALAGLPLYAQTINNEDSLEAQLKREKEIPPFLQAEKPNEIVTGTVTFSGIAVELMKTDNPLELINPAAPVEYGLAEDNVVRDPITDKASGLKLFSIQF